MAQGDDLDAAVARIVTDRQHGARWLAHASAETMALACRQPPSARALGDVHAIAQRLATARPSMAAVANTVARIWNAGSGEPASANMEARFRRMDSEARQLQRYWDAVDQDLIRHALPVLHGVIYTHSRSGTVEAMLKALIAAHTEERRVVVAESRPGGEGVGLAAELISAGWKVTLVADAASGLYIPEVDVVLIGADSVRRDGAVVNKVGSYPLALVAREHKKPFYVICESLKVAPAALPLMLERLPSGPIHEGTAGAPLDTIAFDVTPASLVTHVITERGILTEHEITHMADAASFAYRALFDGGAIPAEEG